MRQTKLISLSAGTLAGIYFIHKYRFLTIGQFASVANLSSDHARKVLHKLEARSAVGYFGYVSIPGHGRTPKVYYLKRRGFEYLRNEGGIDEEELGAFTEAHQEVSWSPQMYHRLRLLDLVISLEMQVRGRPHLELIETFIEYRRVLGTHQRETSDYVAEPFTSETRLVPDGRLFRRRGWDRDPFEHSQEIQRRPGSQPPKFGTIKQAACRDGYGINRD